VKEKVDDECERGARDEGADVFELAHACDRIAHAPGLEISERQGEQVPEQPRAQLDIDAVRGMREEIGAKPAHDGFEQRDADKADDELVERGLRPVHEHLVDHT
jgi:hypothetical protein